MYIAIDLDRMSVVYKHDDLDVVCGLAWIGLHKQSYTVFNCLEYTNFNAFPMNDLMLLYKAITGKKWTHRMTLRSVVIRAITEMCINGDNTKARAVEVTAQSRCVSEKDPDEWRYVYGSNKPSKAYGLFKPFTFIADTVLEQNILDGDIEPIPEYVPPVRAITVNRKNSLKDIIWPVAEGDWINANKPTGITELLTLRRAIMKKLETEYKIPMSKASPELGRWQANMINVSKV